MWGGVLGEGAGTPPPRKWGGLWGAQVRPPRTLVVYILGVPTVFGICCIVEVFFKFIALIGKSIALINGMIRLLITSSVNQHRFR